MKRITSALALFAILTAQMAVASAAGRVAPQAATLFDLLPDSSGVIAINVAQLSAQIERIAAVRPELAARVRAQLDQFAARAVDLRAVEQVVIGFSLADAKGAPEVVVVASGAFNEADILARLRQDSGRKWKAKTYNGQRLYLEPANKKLKKAGKHAVAFFDNGSRLTFGSAEAVRRVADTRAGSRPSAAQNQALMAAIGQAGAASIRFAFVVPESLRERLRNAQGGGAILKPLAAVREVNGSVDLSDAGLLANVTLVNGTEAEAAEVLNLINGGLALLRMAVGSGPEGEIIGQLLDGVTVAQAVANINITANIPAELIRRLIEQVQTHVPRH